MLTQHSYSLYHYFYSFRLLYLQLHISGFLIGGNTNHAAAWLIIALHKSYTNYKVLCIIFYAKITAQLCIYKLVFLFLSGFHSYNKPICSHHP